MYDWEEKTILSPETYIKPAPTPLELVGNVRKIAVLRANGIGDFIFSLPALSALRAAYPNAEIVLLGLEWQKEFLTGRPGPVDRVEVVPESKGVSGQGFVEEDPRELGRFFRRMQDEQFDIAVQIHGGGRYSNPFVRRLGARLTVGLCSPEAERLDLWVPYSYYQPEVFRYLEVVSLIGASQIDLTARLFILPEDLEESFKVVPENGKPLVVFHPGAGDPRRRWPEEKFAAVGSALAWAGAHVVVTGSGPECDLVERVVSRMAANAENLCGRLSLAGLAGLLSRASVVVSNDSGPLHLAAAVGAPTVGIFWCGNLILAGPVTRTQHRPALSWQLNCPVCGVDNTKMTCEHDASFVSDVSQEEVTASAFELLNLHARVAEES